MNVLPDSRLKDAKETVMGDWELPDPITGLMKKVRLEFEPIFCINCGKPNGYVPMHIGMATVTWFCKPCSEKWGMMANDWMLADQVFWQIVAGEMLDRFGRALTQDEINVLAEQGRLGTALEKLDRESPYRV